MTRAFWSSRRVTLGTACALTVAVVATLGAQGKNDRPKVNLRAQPSVSVAPARIVLTAELTGGSDDFEEYYCPSIEWEWGDDTSSESSTDCEPYTSGKSQIRRRYTVEHTFRRDGGYKVYFHMKRRDKILGSASVLIQVQPGAGGFNP
jgi:hypothetical protein